MNWLMGKGPLGPLPMHSLSRQMQSQIIVDGIKVSDYPDDKLSVYGILKHDHNWDVSRRKLI